MVKESIKEGYSFGLTSAVITTLGLMVGLYSGTNSKVIVLGGILTIALADAFSDALGMHISEEAENRHTEKEVWAATLSTFFSKLVIALTFLVPVLLLELKTAIIVSGIWGFALMIFISFKVTKKGKLTKIKSTLEHIIIAVLVIVATYYAGKLIPLLLS